MEYSVTSSEKSANPSHHTIKYATILSRKNIYASLEQTYPSTTLGYIYNPLPGKDIYELISKAL